MPPNGCQFSCPHRDCNETAMGRLVGIFLIVKIFLFSSFLYTRTVFAAQWASFCVRTFNAHCSLTIYARVQSAPLNAHQLLLLLLLKSLSHEEQEGKSALRARAPYVHVFCKMHFCSKSFCAFLHLLLPLFGVSRVRSTSFFHHLARCCYHPPTQPRSHWERENENTPNT